MFTAYALQQKGFDVTLFEKSSKFSRFGGPIQLASNALSCINALSPDLFGEIMTRFTFTGTRKCGIKVSEPFLSATALILCPLTPNLFPSPYQTRMEFAIHGILFLMQLQIWQNGMICLILVRLLISSTTTFLCDFRSLPYLLIFTHTMNTGVIDRPDLQEILLSKIKEGTVINSMGVKKYTEHKDGTVDLTFEDGSESKGFDVLVGADGIWSSIRAQMWNEPTAKPGTATYSGYTLFAAETVMDPKSDFFKDEGYFDAGYKVYIGPGKYFVTSDVGSGRIQWYAFLALPPGSKSRTSNREFVKEQFNGWTNEIHACLDNTPEEIIEQRDLYDRRPSVFKSWSKGHVTMLGDAVHPMMPNLGQGGCQAMEDGFVLTNLLCSVTDKSQLKATLQDYYSRRIVRSAIVQGMSRFSSDIIISAFSTPFNFGEFMKEGLKYKYLVPQSLATSYLQIFLPLIFYAQFGYLYSFSPSSFGRETIKKYVKDSLVRNKAEAGNVYDQLKDGFNTYFTAKTMQFMRYNKATSEVSVIADAKDMRCVAIDEACDLPDIPPIKA